VSFGGRIAYEDPKKDEKILLYNICLIPTRSDTGMIIIMMMMVVVAMMMVSVTNKYELYEVCFRHLYRLLSMCI
jgi:hypothetical protein